MHGSKSCDGRGLCIVYDIKGPIMRKTFPCHDVIMIDILGWLLGRIQLQLGSRMWHCGHVQLWRNNHQGPLHTGNCASPTNGSSDRSWKQAPSSGVSSSSPEGGCQQGGTLSPIISVHPNNDWERKYIMQMPYYHLSGNVAHSHILTVIIIGPI